MSHACPATNLRFDYRVNFSMWLHDRKYFSAVPEVRNSQQLKRPLKAREVINRFIIGSHDICEHLWLWQTGSRLSFEEQRIVSVRFLGELLTQVFADIGEIPDDITAILQYLCGYDGKRKNCIEHTMRETISDWIGVCSVHEAANRSTPEEGVKIQVGMILAPHTIKPKEAANLKRIQSDALHALVSAASLVGRVNVNSQYFALRAVENAKDAIYGLDKIYPYTVFVRQALPVTLFIRELSDDWLKAFERENRPQRAPRKVKVPPVLHETQEAELEPVSVYSDGSSSSQAVEYEPTLLQRLTMARGLGLLFAQARRKSYVSG